MLLGTTYCPLISIAPQIYKVTLAPSYILSYTNPHSSLLLFIKINIYSHGYYKFNLNLAFNNVMHVCIYSSKNHKDSE